MTSIQNSVLQTRFISTSDFQTRFGSTLRVPRYAFRVPPFELDWNLRVPTFELDWTICVPTFELDSNLCVQTFELDSHLRVQTFKLDSNVDSNLPVSAILCMLGILVRMRTNIPATRSSIAVPYV